MKRLPISTRVAILARVLGNPSSGLAAFDNIGVVPVVDPHRVLWVRIFNGTSSGVQLNGAPSTQSASSAPAVATQASAAAPADGSGQNGKNVIVKLSWSLGDTAAGATGLVVLRDGATGVGAIVWQKRVGPLVANGYWEDQENWPIGGGIPGSANNAMTVEFTAAPSATGQQSVALTTYLAT